MTPKTSIASDPSWSPDGRWLAFDTSGAGEIWKVRASGGKPVQLTHRRDDGDSSPAWSPDGRLIAFVRRVDGRGQIWVMGRDGRDAHPIHMDRGLSASHPAWSRDGARIAFVATRGNRARIEVTSADGGATRALTSPHLDAWNPVWLPHDAGIAFLEAGSGDGAGNLFVMRPSGRGVHRLTHWRGRFRTGQFAWVGAHYGWGRC
ncbi:MAG TPA: LpqB family beta-propeller domain-containing protein [Gaiellaceae bacterium]|nr:LpqB family beta-propeller domain-containing protein [Gaiellaceae bacterium]